MFRYKRYGPTNIRILVDSQVKSNIFFAVSVKQIGLQAENTIANETDIKMLIPGSVSQSLFTK